MSKRPYSKLINLTRLFMNILPTLSYIVGSVYLTIECTE